MTSATASRPPPLDSKRAGAATRRAVRRDDITAPPYDAVLGQMVTIKEDGVERRVTAAEAFLLYMTKRGLEGDVAAARSGDGRDRGGPLGSQSTWTRLFRTLVVVSLSQPGSVNTALRPLRMASKLDAIGRVPEWCSSHGWWRRLYPGSVTDVSQWMSKPPLFAQPELRAKWDGPIEGARLVFGLGSHRYRR